jgi:hypothetical protein
MHTRKCACGLDRILFFLHCFEFSQFRKKYPSHVPFTTFAGMFTWELRLKFVLIWIQSSLMPFCLVCATPGLAFKSVRFLVMNDDCFTIQHQPIDLCNGSTLVGHQLNHYIICNNFGFGRVIHSDLPT